MIHDYPNRLDAVALDDDLPIVAPRHNRSLMAIILILIGASIALAVILPQIDIRALYDRIMPSKPVVTAPLRTAQQAALIAATQGEEASIVAEGDAAAVMNAALPFSTAPVESAKPFYLTDTSMTNGEKALRCLTQAVYYEAGFEPVSGRYAVAQVIMNRMRHPAFPKSVCGVVYQGSHRPGCQFSFACDGSLLRAPNPRAWADARQVANDILTGAVASTVGMATHYHANYVSPYWAPKLHKINQLGAHIFYRWPGNWGKRVAFNGVYRGGEFIPMVSSLANINANAEVPGEEALLTADTQAPVQDVTDRRANNDIGGRIDTSKTWRLTIPMGSETRAATPAPDNIQLQALEAAQ
jgi:spore germination cell wall hydrolase CwlJ-like protein